MKTACVYHSIDLDGWMSAAIVKKWWDENRPENTETDIQSIEFIGYNYGDSVPDLLKYDKIIMCDVSFSGNIIRELTHSKEVIWCDHHISAINDVNAAFEEWNLKSPKESIKGIRDTRFSACELTWKHLMQGMNGDPDKESETNRMPEIVRLLGRYDCFGHKGTSEEKKVLEFQYGARSCISNMNEAFDYLEMCCSPSNNISGFAKLEKVIHTQGEGIYKFLCADAQQSYKNGFDIYLEEPVPLPNYTTTRKFICINKERFNPINFGIDYHADGYDGAACFHYANGQWNFSLYNDNGKVDCSMICKTLGGGGHKGAAGFRIKDIYQIIK